MVARFLLNRREALAAAVATTLSIPPSITRADDDGTTGMRRSVEAARSFLVRLFDSSVDLLPEYAGAKDYWLYHDNYVAAKVLDPSHPRLSARIRDAIRRHGVSESGKIEIVFDEAANPLPFRVPELVTVAMIDDKRIRTERLTNRAFTAWQRYADLLLLAAIVKARADAADAKRHFHAAMKMWDGRGFRDEASRQDMLYSTYKLALALLAANRLGLALPIKKEALRRLREQEGAGGGWRTDYDRKGRPRGKVNVESTCLVIVALDREAAHGEQIRGGS